MQPQQGITNDFSPDLFMSPMSSPSDDDPLGISALVQGLGLGTDDLVHDPQIEDKLANSFIADWNCPISAKAHNFVQNNAILGQAQAIPFQPVTAPQKTTNAELKREFCYGADGAKLLTKKLDFKNQCAIILKPSGKDQLKATFHEFDSEEVKQHYGNQKPIRFDFNSRSILALNELDKKHGAKLSNLKYEISDSAPEHLKAKFQNTDFSETTLILFDRIAWSELYYLIHLNQQKEDEKKEQAILTEFTSKKPERSRKEPIANDNTRPNTKINEQQEAKTSHNNNTELLKENLNQQALNRKKHQKQRTERARKKEATEVEKQNERYEVAKEKEKLESEKHRQVLQDIKDEASNASS